MNGNRAMNRIGIIALVMGGGGRLQWEGGWGIYDGLNAITANMGFCCFNGGSIFDFVCGFCGCFGIFSHFVAEDNSGVG
jgi:hypothetical protein